MKFTAKDLDWAVEESILTSDVRDNLVSALKRKYEHRPSLTFANVLYYLGGLIIIGAMTLYVGMSWDDLRGGGYLAVALVYAALFVGIGNWLWKGKGLRIPGGILITAAVCMTPMAVFGVQDLTGWWIMDAPGKYRDFYVWIRSGWTIMEIATLVTGLIALRFYRFPFITMPMAFCLWFLSMDITAVIYGTGFSWDERKLVSLWFGLAMLVVSFLVDRRTRDDFAFWGYLFGMIAFWGGLSMLRSNSELSKFIYCMINVGLMMLSVLLSRRVFIVFGALGVAGYLGHLASSVFRDSFMFTFALSALGLGVIGLGLLYHRNRERIESAMFAMLPDWLMRNLPQNRG